MHPARAVRFPNKSCSDPATKPTIVWGDITFAKPAIMINEHIFDLAKRVLDRLRQITGVTQRWQERDSTFGWWLIGTPRLDFLVLATSDVKWYAAGTYDEPPDGPRSRMAFPVDLAQEWMTDLINTQQLLDLANLVWRAYAWRHSIPHEQQPICEALNGFTIYIGLLNRVTSTR